MAKKAAVSEDAIKRLARYWFRAQLLRDLTHAMRDQYDGGLVDMPKEDWWEFETYLMHWLSGLFVVVEGFNKLRLEDKRVTRLFKEHVSHLKKVRHETYHFVVELSPSVTQVFSQLNWAEELHDAIGEHIKEIVSRRGMVERFLEFRARQKK